MEKVGAPGANRTPNPQLRRLLLCPIELQAQSSVLPISLMAHDHAEGMSNRMDRIMDEGHGGKKEQIERDGNPESKKESNKNPDPRR